MINLSINELVGALDLPLLFEEQLKVKNIYVNMHIFTKMIPSKIPWESGKYYAGNVSVEGISYTREVGNIKYNVSSSLIIVIDKMSNITLEEGMLNQILEDEENARFEGGVVMHRYTPNNDGCMTRRNMSLPCQKYKRLEKEGVFQEAKLIS